jgi:hypothetical protein
VLEVKGASLKEEAAYTDACAGDGVVTDYSDDLTSEFIYDSGNIIISTDCWSIYLYPDAPDSFGYPTWSGSFNNQGVYPHTLSYNHDLGRWEEIEYVNGQPYVIYADQTNSTTPSCVAADYEYVIPSLTCDPNSTVFNCDAGAPSEEVFTLVRTFKANDGCNETECKITYTWSEEVDTPESTTPEGNPEGGPTHAFDENQAQAAPGEGEDMGVELDFTAFPVPFDSVVSVKFNFEFDTDVTIEVHDTKGLLIMSETLKGVRKDSDTTRKLDLSKGADQLFYITVTTNQGSVTKKVVSSMIKRR